MTTSPTICEHGRLMRVCEECSSREVMEQIRIIAEQIIAMHHAAADGSCTFCKYHYPCYTACLAQDIHWLAT